MNKQETIYGIIVTHDKPTINQDDLTDAYIEFTGDNITNREVRRVIETCINEEKYLIISTPHRPGGYAIPVNRYEGYACANRLRNQGLKLIEKANKIANMTDQVYPKFGVEQMNLPDVRQKKVGVGA